MIYHIHSSIFSVAIQKLVRIWQSQASSKNRYLHPACDFVEQILLNDRFSLVQLVCNYCCNHYCNYWIIIILPCSHFLVSNLLNEYCIIRPRVPRLAWQSYLTIQLIRILLQLWQWSIIWQTTDISVLTHRGPVDLRKWAIFNTILMSPKSWLSQEDLDAGFEHSMVPMDSLNI